MESWLVPLMWKLLSFHIEMILHNSSGEMSFLEEHYK